MTIFKVSIVCSCKVLEMRLIMVASYLQVMWEGLLTLMLALMEHLGKLHFYSFLFLYTTRHLLCV